MDSIYQIPDSLLQELYDSFKAPESLDNNKVVILYNETIKAKSQAYMKLYDLTWRSLLPKSKELTELDRKTDLDGRTAEIKTVCGQLDDYLKLLEHLLIRPNHSPAQQ